MISKNPVSDPESTWKIEGSQSRASEETPLAHKPQLKTPDAPEPNDDQNSWSSAKQAYRQSLTEASARLRWVLQATAGT